MYRAKNGDVMGCHRLARRHVRLVDKAYDIANGFDYVTQKMVRSSLRVSGRYTALAWTWESGAAEGVSVGSWDLRTRKLSFYVEEAEAPPLVARGEHSWGSVTDLELNDAGALAWITARGDRDSECYSKVDDDPYNGCQVHAVPAVGHTWPSGVRRRRVIDTGAHVATHSLSLAGPVATWINGGQTMSATLP